MNEEQIEKVLEMLVELHGEDCVDEVAHYGGLRGLLSFCDGSKEGIEEAWGEACNNV
jgi:hypothetical protein